MARPYTEARRNSNKEWDSNNLDRISVALPKGTKERIKAHVETRRESVNKFINRAIDETILRDMEKDSEAELLSPENLNRLIKNSHD